MYIKQLIFKNFRNLKEVNLYNLSKLVVLIGENNSGKTNILEALELFFNDFDYPHEQNKGNLSNENCYLWFDGDTSKEIEFEVILSGLTNTQCKKLGEAANTKQQKGDLAINRSIFLQDNTIIYRNNSIDWGGISIKCSGNGYDGYSAGAGGELSFEPIQFAQILVENILKNAFVYIPISRGTELRSAHGSILDHDIRDELIKKGGESSFRGMQQWNKTRQWYSDRGWTQGQLDCRGSQLITQRGTTPLPYELEGTGYQAILNLLRRVEMSGEVIAIEEPEHHLHPRLQKTLVKEIKDTFGTGKQVFLSTHSPFILDLVNISSIWSIYKYGLEGEAQNISSVEGVSNVLQQIGVKPSDLLLANGILVVEGLTDRDVYTDWARKIEKPFETASIVTIDVKGAGNIKKYLASAVVQGTCIKTYALCDANSEATVRKAIKGIVPDENILNLKKGDIEDYYPRELVLEFAKELAIKKGKIESEIPTEIQEGATVKTLDKLLGGDWWKRQLADKVIKEMKAEQIDPEIKTKLSKIYDSIY